MADVKPPRDEDEIVRAHDILALLARGKMDLGESTGVDGGIEAQLDVLCWVLHHDHNGHFARDLARLENMIAEQGLRMEKKT